jgi:hypothetical protein
MKKFSQFSSLVFMALLSVLSVTVANAQYRYTGDKPIYPAVIQAITNGGKSYWSESKVTVMNPNTIVAENVRVSDGIQLAEFTLRISLENEVVTYQFSNIRKKPPATSNWTQVDKFSQSGREQIFTSYFDKEIPKVMGNEANYAKAKEAADKKLGGAPNSGALKFSLALQNPQNYLIYPAVGEAFNSLKAVFGAKTADLYDISCLDNEFTIKNCVATRGEFNYISYWIKIAYQQNQLAIEFTNIERMDASFMTIYDRELETLTRFITDNISDQLKTQIEKSLANADAYKAAKKAFLENNNFLSRAFSPINSILMDEFTTKLFKDGEISLTGIIVDVKKNEKAEFKNYTMEISASMRTDSRGALPFGSIILYTSDNALARLKSGEKVTLSGKFVRVEEKLGYYFTLTK